MSKPKCLICQDPKVAEINLMLEQGTPQRHIAERIGRSVSSINHHKRYHCGITQSTAPLRKMNLEPALGSALNQIHNHKAAVWGIARSCTDNSLWSQAIAAYKELRGWMTLEMTATGQLKPNTVNDNSTKVIAFFNKELSKSELLAFVKGAGKKAALAAADALEPKETVIEQAALPAGGD